MKQFYKVVFLLFMAFSLHAQGDPVEISCEGSLTVDVGGSSTGDSLTISGVTTDNMCDPTSGDVTGSIDITVLGGTPFTDVDGNESYVYYWEQDGSMYSIEEDLENLVAGTYCVTVTTALTPSQAAAGLTESDCIIEACYVITQPPPVTLSLDTDPLTCNEFNGAPDGVVTATAGGGVPYDPAPEYLYEWEYEGSYTDNLVNTSGSPNTNPLDEQVDLPAGWYFVTVYDSQGCAANDSIEITQPDSLLLEIASIDPSCNLINDPTPNGSITPTLTNGSSPFVYIWSFEDPDGNVNNAHSTSASLTDQGPGTYSVTVTDSNGCTVEGQVILDEPTPVEIAGTPDEPDCNAGSGALDGAINIVPSGGTGTDGLPADNVDDYTYAWTGTGVNATAQNQTGLGSGTYNVTVTDANGCTATDEYTLTEPEAIAVNGTPDQPDCNAGSGALDGAIDIEPTGGTGVYTYAWTGTGVDASAQDQTGLGTGTYNVTVTDANGCSATDEYTLTEPEAVAVNGSTDEPDCNSESGALDGSITIAPTGGTGVYTYAWTGPGVDATAQNQTGLGTGTYNVTVTDANDCTDTAEFTLTEPEAVAVNGSTDEPDCNDGSGALDGSITIAPTGGTGVYTYAWTGPGVDATAQNQTGLGTGTYNVTVTDANDCTDTAEFTLTEPEAVAVNGSFDEPDCNDGSGDLDGSITIAPTGGTGTYTYAWTGPGVDATAQNQTGLGTGTYNVTVTDANNCTDTAEFTLTEPEAVAVNGTTDEPDCNNGSGVLDGSITVAPTGGTGTYTYAWTGPGVDATAQNQTGLGTGTYNVTVTDANNCTDTAEFTLTEPEAVAVNGSFDEPDCNDGSGDLDGSITIAPTGGTGTYTYAWTGPGVDATAQNQTGLGTGTYNVTVTDVNNCTDTAEFTLTEPEAIAINGTPDFPDCNAGSGVLDGAIDIEPTGGTGTYTYAWTSTGSSVDATAQDQSDLGAGTYSVTVTDVNGCSATEAWTLTEPDAVEITIGMTPLTCNAALAPTDGTVTISITGGTDTNGDPADDSSDYTIVWGDSGLGETGTSLNGLPAGTYSVTVTDANGCSDDATIDVPQPTTIDIFAESINPECNDVSGAPDGSITILTATGGTGSDDNEGDELTDYTYTWAADPGNAYDDNLDQSSNTITAQTGLTAGTYYLTVTDENGCMLEADYTLEEPTPITVTGDIIQPACNDASGVLSGEIDITPGGGEGATNTPIYTYEWSGPGISGGAVTQQDQTGLGEGWYYVTVYDENCSAVDSFNLTEPEPVVCVLDQTPEGGCNDLLCAGSTDTIFVIPSGGTAPYTYSLDGATAIGDSFFIVGAGTYTVTTIDANNCESTCDITLDEPNPLAGGTCTLDDDCQIGEGQIEVAATGGCAPYTVTWTSPTGGTLVPDPADVDIDGNVIIDTEGGSTIFTGAEGGETYNFTIIDANGCQIP